MIKIENCFFCCFVIRLLLVTSNYLCLGRLASLHSMSVPSLAAHFLLFFLFPLGVQFSVTQGIRFCGIFDIWPNHLSRFLFTVADIGSECVPSYKALFVTLSTQNIRLILLRTLSVQLSHSPTLGSVQQYGFDHTIIQVELYPLAVDLRSSLV